MTLGPFKINHGIGFDDGYTIQQNMFCSATYCKLSQTTCKSCIPRQLNSNFLIARPFGWIKKKNIERILTKLTLLVNFELKTHHTKFCDPSLKGGGAMGS